MINKSAKLSVRWYKHCGLKSATDVPKCIYVYRWSLSYRKLTNEKSHFIIIINTFSLNKRYIINRKTIICTVVWKRSYKCNFTFKTDNKWKSLQLITSLFYDGKYFQIKLSVCCFQQIVSHGIHFW